MINARILSDPDKSLVELVEHHQRRNYEGNLKIDCDEGHEF